MRTAERTDGQTDMTKLMVAFRNFAKAPNKYSLAHTMYLSVSYDSQHKPIISLNDINRLKPTQ